MSTELPVEWFEELPGAVTVCDTRYKILYLNGRAAEVNARDGGKALIGRNMMECHPPEAQEKLRRVMMSGRPNIYTIEKGGVRKMIYQAHWRRNGTVGGLLELSFELPGEIPHFVRTGVNPPADPSRPTG